jgi:hypothetical protein
VYADGAADKTNEHLTACLCAFWYIVVFATSRYVFWPWATPTMIGNYAKLHSVLYLLRFRKRLSAIYPPLKLSASRNCRALRFFQQHLFYFNSYSYRSYYYSLHHHHHHHHHHYHYKSTLNIFFAEGMSDHRREKVHERIIRSKFFKPSTLTHFTVSNATFS